MDEVGVFRTRDFRARDENSSSFSRAFLINQNKKISTYTHTYTQAHVQMLTCTQVNSLQLTNKQSTLNVGGISPSVNKTGNNRGKDDPSIKTEIGSVL